MALAGFPESGSQIRRKSDGVLGEVYSVDPPEKLSVRWASIPGAYHKQDCTPDQFARAWELTGARLARPRETRVAISLIALTVLVFLGFVLRNASSSYAGYQAYHPPSADPPAVLNSVRALKAKYAIEAQQVCAAGADEYIRSLTRNRFHWEVADSLAPRFDRFSSALSAPGVLTLLTNHASVSNGFGVFQTVEIACNYDTQTREVLSYEGGEVQQ